MWESMGMLKTFVACSRVGPKITCISLSKVGSPGRGARYERRDNASAFPWCFPGCSFSSLPYCDRMLPNAKSDASASIMNGFPDTHDLELEPM